MNTNLRKTIFFAILVGLAFVAYAYMIKPANESLIEQKTAMEQKRAKLRELENATITAEDLNKQLVQMEEVIEMFESKLPPKSEIHKVLKNVTVIARKHGLTPKTIRTLSRKTNNGYIEQPLKMELHGNFNSYYAFLLELEKLDRIMKIRKLNLKKQHKNEGGAEATFEVSIFFQDANT